MTSTNLYAQARALAVPSQKGELQMKLIVAFILTSMLFLALQPMTASASVEGGIPPDVTNREEAKNHGNDGMYFEETGFNVAGDFWYYWRDHGLDLGHEGVSFSESLALFGYPITRAFEEKFEDGSTRWVQYFERARFEIHEENKGTEFYVLLGHFGRDIMATFEWPADVTDPASPKDGDCMFFEETSHNVCGDFMFYWMQNGGLMVFGYPIGEPTNQTFEDGSTLWVQYFERGRMEIHEENKGTPYYVLLGHFGREVLEMRMNSGEGSAPVAPAPDPDPDPAPAPPPSGGGTCEAVMDSHVDEYTEFSAAPGLFIHLQVYIEGQPEVETLLPAGRYKNLRYGELQGWQWHLGPECSVTQALNEHVGPSIQRRQDLLADTSGYVHWSKLAEWGWIEVIVQTQPVPDIPYLLP